MWPKNQKYYYLPFYRKLADPRVKEYIYIHYIITPNSPGETEGIFFKVKRTGTHCAHIATKEIIIKIKESRTNIFKYKLLPFYFYHNTKKGLYLNPFK